LSDYQAIYDAVRSRISNGDIGSAVEAAFRDANLSHYAEQAMHHIAYAFADYQRPSVLYRPRLSLDGNMWIALYGDNLAEGCVGCGESPELAMAAFDKEWATKYKKPGEES
jgi:hypothetical protein